MNSVEIQNTPLVSVVMITFKHEKFIAEAIEGVLMQECDFDVELIIADDCSPDNTEEIVQNYIVNHPKGHWIKYQRHEKNIGMMPNFIWALKQAKGDYIALCEGDDYWTSKNKLLKQVSFLKQNPKFTLCFHNTSIHHNGAIIGEMTKQIQDEFSTKDLFLDHFIATSSVVYRNSIKIPEWFYKVSSGDKALLLVLSLGGKIKFLNEIMSVYCLHPGGVSNTHFGIKKVYDMSTLLNEFDKYSEYKYTDNCKKSLLHEIEVHIFPHLLSNMKTTHIIKELLKRLKYKLKVNFFTKEKY